MCVCVQGGGLISITSQINKVVARKAAHKSRQIKMSKCTANCSFSLYDDGLYHCDTHQIPHLCDVAKCLEIENGVYRCKFTQTQTRVISTTASGAPLRAPSFRASRPFDIKGAIEKLQAPAPPDKHFTSFAIKLYSWYISQVQTVTMASHTGSTFIAALMQSVYQRDKFIDKETMTQRVMWFPGLGSLEQVKALYKAAEKSCQAAKKLRTDAMRDIKIVIQGIDDLWSALHVEPLQTQ